MHRGAQCGKKCTLDISGEPHRDRIILMASDTEADSAAFTENDIGIYAQLKEGCPYGGGAVSQKTPAFPKRFDSDFSTRMR